ncbi:MAG TPA: hypothetical protein VJQ54_04600 [Candidatus Sulfotelmatobacter sp.]|nr:hypothetical protein [Candidatus Sulfotelmatobacter sp.]
MKGKTVRLPVMMEPLMIENIDEWSFQNRVRTRAGAVRMLIEKALAAEKTENEKAEARA